ncbi:hypothetical protein ENBRE01_1762 [Enteropsectra breve]|nr:hypothetical protein ENBRE01_1762 [Enteropsectra breve]
MAQGENSEGAAVDEGTKMRIVLPDEKDATTRAGENNSSSLEEQNAGREENEKVTLKLQSIMDDFSPENKLKFEAVMKEMKGCALDNTEQIRLMENFMILNSNINTPYFFFYKEELYELYIASLRSKLKIENNFKIQSADILLEHYSATGLFNTLLVMYSELDTFHVDNVMFKNYLLQKVLHHLYAENENYTQDFLFFAQNCVFYENIKYAMGFVEFLIKGHKDPVSANALLSYACNFAVLNLQNDIKDFKKKEEIEDKIIPKIFTAYYGLMKTLVRHRRNSGDLRNNKNGALETHILKDDSNNLDIKDTGEIEPNRKSHIKDRHSKNKLFKHNDKKDIKHSSTVLLSVYKKLFFYFLHRNKRIFASVKVMKVFNRKEIREIYHEIRNTKQSFINVFKQLDCSYLLRELEDTDVFLSVDEDKLNSNELETYYKSYIKLLSEKSSIENKELSIELKDPLTFARVFMEETDRSFIKQIKVRKNERDCQFIEEIKRFISGPADNFANSNNYTDFVSFSDMIYYYTLIHNDIFIDKVSLCSIILDNPDNLLKKRYIYFFNNILEGIHNCLEHINSSLIIKINKILARLIEFSEYRYIAGKILNRTISKASLSSSYNNKESNNKESTNNNLIGNSNAIMAALDCPANIENNHVAILYHVLYHPDEIDKYSIEILSLLSHRTDAEHLDDDLNINTLILLRFIEKLFLTDCLENTNWFLFVANNLQVFYTIKNTGLVTSIFIQSLKAKAVLPCMVLPYIVPYCSSENIYRKYGESVIDSISIVMEALVENIRRELLAADEEEKDGNKAIDRDTLKRIIERQTKSNFIYILSKFYKVKKIIDKLEYNNDIMIVYLVLKLIRDLSYENKTVFFRSMEENVCEDEILVMVDSSKEFYKKMNNGILPIEYLISKLK